MRYVISLIDMNIINAFLDDLMNRLEHHINYFIELTIYYGINEYQFVNMFIFYHKYN